MRTSAKKSQPVRQPILLPKAVILMDYLKSLNVDQIASIMKIKPDLAQKTSTAIYEWNTKPSNQITAIDAFLGDIYSGLQVSTLTKSDRQYADKELIILSGLYGLIRPLDGIATYRLEMAYRLVGFETPNLYQFWGDTIANQISDSEQILNLSSVEYSKVITDYVDPIRVISPRFLTMNKKTKQPTFVVVHAKIARGAFAGWVIKNRIKDSCDLSAFTDLGYAYSSNLSKPTEPVFICNTFKGLGMSVRLT